MPLAEGDNINEKESFFWNGAPAARVVYAPPADDPKNNPSNMLLGYPGRSIYSSKEVGPDERFEVVVDLTRVLALSRLRLVWDNAHVPRKWAVDTSVDGADWKPWVQGDDKALDGFSWWPGYEYYGADPIQARYLRYKPLESANRSIRLRSLSVYR
jgi:hypothetical protein